MDANKKIASFRFGQRDFEQLDALVKKLEEDGVRNGVWFTTWTRTAAIHYAVKAEFERRSTPTSDNVSSSGVHTRRRRSVNTGGRSAVQVRIRSKKRG